MAFTTPLSGRPREGMSRTYIATIAASVVGGLVLTVIFLYVLSWKLRRRKLKAAEPDFTIVDPRGAFDIEASPKVAELDAASDDVRSKRTSRWSVNDLGALFQAEVYELDGRGITPKNVPRGDQRGSWLRSFMSRSVIPTGSHPVIEHASIHISLAQPLGSNKETAQNPVEERSKLLQSKLHVEVWQDLELQRRSLSQNLRSSTVFGASSRTKVNCGTQPGPNVLNISQRWNHLRIPVSPIPYNVIGKASTPTLPLGTHQCEETWI